MYAQHHLNGAADGESYLVRGLYDSHMIRTTDGWRVEHVVEAQLREGGPRYGTGATRFTWLRAGGRQVPVMSRISATKWLRLRLVFAVGVLALLAIELTGHRSWPVLVLQVLLIVGIVITSALDLRELRGRNSAAPGPPPA